MKLIPLSSLVIPDNRQRKEFPPAALEELKRSILTKGLMHPPVVRNDGVTLVAGERRTRAITELTLSGETFFCNGVLVGEGNIPVTLLSDLPPLALREAELEENIFRVDLLWQEKAAAIADLHALRTAQAATLGAFHTITDTATEITGSAAKGSDITSTHEAILLSQHLQDSEVAGAKTQKEAIKILRKKKEAAHRAILAAGIDMSAVRHDLRCGSMTDLILTLPSESFDCILTDPPYGVNADSFGDMASTGHNYKDDWETAHELYKILASEGFRVAKSEAHAYVFCDFARFPEVSLTFALAGWEVWPRPIIWDKGNGMLPRPEHGPRYTYETILFASKGGKRTLCVKSDIIRVPGDGKLLHGAQKPVALYEDLLSRSCLPGATVLDPFGGSGPLIPAANSRKLTATLFELIPSNFDICLSRLEETPSFPELPNI
jgi:DNA modification methylase/ParB-like chromosome segregation protein Spo0J